MSQSAILRLRSGQVCNPQSAIKADFIAAFDVWEEARPYLDLVVDECEMRLVVLMHGQALTADEAAGLMGLSRDEAAAFLTRCYGRGIVNKRVEGGDTRYVPADFYERLDYFVKYEPASWDDLPAEVRRTLDRRYLTEFIVRQRPKVESALRGEARDELPNDAVLLLSEVEEMIEAATTIVVLPCDCRRLGQNCDRPVETCMQFDQVALAALDRGHGRRLTQAEAKALVRRADRKGLMHTGDSEWRQHELRTLCNCCACDCYPFRAAAELGSKDVWPRSRYVAVHDGEQCNLCGSCVKRCHFQAFYHDGTTALVEDKVRPNVRFDPGKCWGCGLCANTCPSDAIAMKKL
ncbi:MAG: 4Fe-4S dicluster domain-containing protein [Chloroflexi bacterium]|nr:4Fe-4S dicluster domain-containing protein [Chloroflexota bacterium]